VDEVTRSVSAIYEQGIGSDVSFVPTADTLIWVSSKTSRGCYRVGEEVEDCPSERGASRDQLAPSLNQGHAPLRGPRIISCSRQWTRFLLGRKVLSLSPEQPGIDYLHS
jgi:hypothetical protein